MARFIALLTFLLSLSSAPAAATSVLYLTDREQAQQSDAVVLATITDQRVERHPVWNRPTTISTVRVDEVLHGTAPAEFEIHQLKGELGGNSTELPAAPTSRRASASCCSPMSWRAAGIRPRSSRASTRSMRPDWVCSPEAT